MGRPREFDTLVFLRRVSELFIKRGFAATSIDEIVKATGVVRGSLYSIFGSKQGIFVAALELAAGQWADPTATNDHMDARDTSDTPAEDTVLLDLLNVAVFEIASHNHKISDLVQHVIDTHGITAQVLGQRALDRAGLTEASSHV